MNQKSQILVLLGKRVREFRREKNISQEELASRACVHRTYIGMIERAEKNITITNLEKISIGLGVTIEELLKE